MGKYPKAVARWALRLVLVGMLLIGVCVFWDTQTQGTNDGLIALARLGMVGAGAGIFLALGAAFAKLGIPFKGWLILAAVMCIGGLALLGSASAGLWGRDDEPALFLGILLLAGGATTGSVALIWRYVRP